MKRIDDVGGVPSPRSEGMHLPHVTPFAKSPIYFFTAGAANRSPLFACTDAHRILTDVWRNSAACDGWYVGRYVVMPDHVHFFARPAVDAKSRAVWCKTWKSITSRQIIQAMGVRPPIWQADTFDHILRNSESYAEKWAYVCANPIRAGLVAKAEDWPWQGEINSLTF